MMETFSVYHEGELNGEKMTVKECDGVAMDLALEAFVRLINSPAAKIIGAVKRVIVTDSGDFTCMEWIAGKGVTYPPELAGRDLSPAARKQGVMP